jgi:hypothetical protein
MKFSWLTFLVSVVTAVSGSTVIERVIRGRQKRSQTGRQQDQQDLENLQDAIEKFRAAVLTGRVPDDNDALRLVRVEYDAALERVVDESVVLYGESYAEVLELFAAEDPDTGEDAERSAFETLQRYIRTAKKAAR